MSAPVENELAVSSEELASRFETYLEKEESGDTPPSDKLPPPEETAQAAEETEAPEAAEETPEPEETEEEAPAKQEAAAEEEFIETLPDLASALGTDENDLLGAIQVPGRDGETITLGQALSAYRDAPANMEAAEASLAGKLATQRADLLRQQDETISTLQRHTALVIRELETEEIPEALLDDDPREYHKRMIRRDAKKKAVEGALDYMDAEAKRRDEAEQTRLAEWRKEQPVLAFKLYPEWKDAKVADQATKDISKYLNDIGLSEDEKKSIEDARMIGTIWEAAQYRKLKAKVPAARKRIRLNKAKSTLTAGARGEERSESAEAEERQAGLIGRLRKSGHVDDAAALFKGIV